MKPLKIAATTAFALLILCTSFEANAETNGGGSYVNTTKCDSGSSHKGCKYSNPPGTKYRKHKTK